MWAKARAVGNAQRCPRAAPVRASASSTCPTALVACAGPHASARACGRPPKQCLTCIVEFLGSLHIGQSARQLLQL